MWLRGHTQDCERKSMNPMLIIAPVAMGLAIALGFWQFIPEPTQTEALQERLARVHASSGFSDDVDVIELEKPFSERVYLPIINALGRVMAKRTKESQLAALRIKLQKAGSQQRPETLMAMQIVVPLIVGPFGYGLTAAIGWQAPKNIAVALVLMILGFYYPISALQGKTKKRAQEIRLALPGALDLLCVAMEAGLSLDAALMRVCEGPDGVLNQEFGKVLGEIHLGRPRSEALLALGERNELPELSSFVRSLVQAEP